MIELVAAALMVLGGVFVALAGIGLLRFPDVLIRMHASTKAGTLGVGLVVIAVAVHFDQLGVTTRALMIVFFLLLTAPVAAHLIGRAAYRTGTRLSHHTRIDELAAALPSADADVLVDAEQPSTTRGGGPVHEAVQEHPVRVRAVGGAE
jgi:multicomponent Na+:H+ antiporter subunit G